MEHLINSLLHFSRLGQQELSMRLVDLNALMHNVSEVLHMSQRETSFEIRIPQPLPVIRGDRRFVELEDAEDQWQTTTWFRSAVLPGGEG